MWDFFGQKDKKKKTDKNRIFTKINGKSNFYVWLVYSGEIINNARLLHSKHFK